VVIAIGVNSDDQHGHQRQPSGSDERNRGCVAGRELATLADAFMRHAMGAHQMVAMTIRTVSPPDAEGVRATLSHGRRWVPSTLATAAHQPGGVVSNERAISRLVGGIEAEQHR